MTENEIFRFWRKTRFSILAGKRDFFVLTRKCIFAVLAGKRDFSILAGKRVFGFGGKMRFWRENMFCGFRGKCVFWRENTFLRFSRENAFLRENTFLQFWAEMHFQSFGVKILILGFREKMRFCGFVSFRVWQNDIMFMFVICELHQGHNRYYIKLNEPFPSKWSKLDQLNGL